MKSIGQLLKNARQKKNFTVEDVYKFIKVHPKYLKALENDDYSLFEGKVHSKGFLKIYVDFLDLDPVEIMALWRREYEPEFDNKKNPKLYKIKYLEPEKFILTPNTIIMSFFTISLLIFFTYLFMQYKNYTDAPNLEIFNPKENQVLATDNLDITGNAELDSEVFINDQKLITQDNGNFFITLKLKEGINTISIKAVNKLAKQTEITRTVIYRPIELKFEPDLTKETTSSQETEVINND